MRTRGWLEQGWATRGAILLSAAGVVVGVAIVVGGTPARTLNGAGAILWLAGTAATARSLRASPRWWPAGVVAVGLALVLAVRVRPSDLVAALIGFGLAGAIAAAAGRDRPVAWALLVPGVYLPAHLALGVGKVLFNGAQVRVEPPPTAAVVPLVMVLAAGLGGAAVAAWRSRRPAVAATDRLPAPR